MKLWRHLYSMSLRSRMPCEYWIELREQSHIFTKPTRCVCVCVRGRVSRQGILQSETTKQKTFKNFIKWRYTSFPTLYSSSHSSRTYSTVYHCDSLQFIISRLLAVIYFSSLILCQWIDSRRMHLISLKLPSNHHFRFQPTFAIQISA